MVIAFLLLPFSNDEPPMLRIGVGLIELGLVLQVIGLVMYAAR